MTDGIIQEVFEKYTLYDLNNSNLSLEDIKQELIKEIRQELTHAGCNTNCKSHMKKLIGDNNG